MSSENSFQEANSLCSLHDSSFQMTLLQMLFVLHRKYTNQGRNLESFAISQIVEGLQNAVSTSSVSPHMHIQRSTKMHQKCQEIQKRHSISTHSQTHTYTHASVRAGRLSLQSRNHNLISTCMCVWKKSKNFHINSLGPKLNTFIPVSHR